MLYLGYDVAVDGITIAVTIDNDETFRVGRGYGQISVTYSIEKLAAGAFHPVRLGCPFGKLHALLCLFISDVDEESE